MPKQISNSPLLINSKPKIEMSKEKFNIECGILRRKTANLPAAPSRSFDEARPAGRH